MKDTNKVNRDLTVLIAPLDWGLGHATRCIPLISFLKEQQIRVLIGGNGAVKEILQQEFPDIQILPLKGYHITYSKKGDNFLISIVLQLPKILHRVWYEYRWLKNTVKKYNIDAVISDNRLGCFNKFVPSVFITHQLNIKTGRTFVNRFVRRINYFFINRYDECWVPDYFTEKNLAGELSHPIQFPKTPIKYIGLLSRFNKHALPIKYKLCILLSGPEPQRTILENKIIQQLEFLEEPSVIIRGTPEKKNTLSIQNKKVVQFNHLNADELSKTIQESEIVIARSGYSTIMDLIALEKKAILIPTPGQAEQEYLGTFLNKKAFFATVSQHQFNLFDSFKLLDGVAHENYDFREVYKNVLTEWILGLKDKHRASAS